MICERERERERGKREKKEQRERRRIDGIDTIFISCAIASFIFLLPTPACSTKET